MDRKRDEERCAVLEHLLEQIPDQEELALERGQVLQRLGRYDDALTTYTQVLQSHPEHAAARRARGQLAFERGYLEQAVQDWDILFTLHQADESVYLGKIQLLTWLGNYYGTRGADDYCHEAIAAYPDQATFYLQKALNPIRRTYPYDEHFIACEQVLFLCRQREPGFSGAFYRDKGQALYLLGRYEEALAAFEQALQLDSSDPRIYRLKACTLQASGQDQLALTAFEAALQACSQRFQRYPNTSLDLLEQSELFCSLQRLDEGLAAIEQALEADPGSARGWFARGEALVRARRYSEALSSYEQAARLSPRYEDIKTVSGSRLKFWLEDARALARCEHNLLDFPENVPLLVQKARLLSRLQRYDEALPVCEQALRLSTDLVNQTPALLSDIYYELGIALQELDRYAEALAAYRQSNELQERGSIGVQEFEYVVDCLKIVVQTQEKLLSDPWDMENIKILLRNLSNIGNRQADQEMYQDLCRSAPDDLEILLQVLSMAYYDCPAALLGYKRVLRIAPDDARVYAGYAELLYNLHRYDDALRAFEQAEQLHTNKSREAGTKSKIEKLFQHRDHILNTMANASVEFLRQGAAAWNAWCVRQPHHSRDLRSLDLSKLDLHAADLSQMDLQQSVLDESDLSEADFHQANLQQASLSHVDVSGTNLRGANLSQARLKGAFLFLPQIAKHQRHWQRDELLPPAITDLCEVTLSGADLSAVCLDYALLTHANLSEANLTHSLLRFANLQQSNLSHADLRSTSLAGADLSGATLCGANLACADLRGACLDGADLRGATLFQTHLENASLRAVDLTQAIFAPVKEQKKTDIPPPLFPFEQPMVPLSASTAEVRPGMLTTLLHCQAPGCHTSMELELIARDIPHEDDQYQIFRAGKQKPVSFICDYLPGYTISWHPAGLHYARLEFALRMGDIALLHHLNKEYAPFYCSCCHGVYCYDHMCFQGVWDGYYPHPDYWYGTCPYGHRVLVNH